MSGKASRTPDYLGAHPDVLWALAYRMRNVLSHGYADVDLDVVWSTAQGDLPRLEDRLVALLGPLSPKTG